MWKLPDGRVLKHLSNKMFKIDEIELQPQKEGPPIEVAVVVQHPERNLLLWKDDELRKRGIYRYIEKRFDAKYYDSTGKTETVDDVTITVEHTVKQRFKKKDLKKEKRKLVRSTVSSLVAPYQWFYNRALDPGEPVVPQEIIDYRKNVREVGKEIEVDIKALSTYQDLIDFQFNDDDRWPTPPDVEEPYNSN